MATLSDSDIVSVAAAYSLPPALLLAIYRQEGYKSDFGMASATLTAYNMSPTQLASDPLLALSIAARTLVQGFSETGNWNSALSVYLTGNAQTAQSPTSPVGGQVSAILGQAAIDPSFGLTSSFVPADFSTFQSASASFTQMLQQESGSGGIVTPQAVTTYQQAAGQVSRANGTQQFSASTDMQTVAEDILTAAKIPVTDANVALIVTMARGEGMPLGDFNWLATTQGQGAEFNSVGVKIFPTYEAGIQATAATLLNGYYTTMVNLMRSGADLKTIASNPEVQKDLRTWQGGSSEDVNNLLRLANVPGTPMDVGGSSSAEASAAPKAPKIPTPETTKPTTPAPTATPASAGKIAQLGRSS